MFLDIYTNKTSTNRVSKSPLCPIGNVMQPTSSVMLLLMSSNELSDGKFS